MINKSKYNYLYNLYKVVFDDIIGNFVIDKYGKDKITFKNPINIYYLDKSGNDLKIKIKNQSLTLNVSKFEDSSLNIKYVFIFTYENDDIVKESKFECRDNSKSIYVYETIKEKRQFGYIIEKIKKAYSCSVADERKMYLVELDSTREEAKRFNEFCPHIPDDGYWKYKFLRDNYKHSSIKIEYLPSNTFVYFKINDNISYRKIKVTSRTNSLLEEEKKDITDIYLDITGDNCINRIYDLYKGIINSRNALDIINTCHYHINDNAYAYSYMIEKKKEEDELCGPFENPNPYCQDYFFIYYLIRYMTGCNKEFDINDYKSIQDILKNQQRIHIDIERCIKFLNYYKNLKSNIYNQINLDNENYLDIIEGIIKRDDKIDFYHNMDNVLNLPYVKKKSLFRKK